MMPTTGADSRPKQFGNLDANLRFIDDTGVLETPADVLEIGTGMGTLLHRLHERGHRVTGVERRQEFIEQALAHYGPLSITRVEGTALPFADKSFDTVVSFDVFEHIRDSDAHLREVIRVLRDGGSYLIQTPNKWTNAAFETIRWRGLGWRDDHCSLHSLGELIARFRRHGFVDIEAFDIPVVNDFFRAKVRQHLGPLGLALLQLVNPDRLPLRFRTNLYVRATKGGAARQ